jgi:hypothetical protein
MASPLDISSFQAFERPGDQSVDELLGLVTEPLLPAITEAQTDIGRDQSQLLSPDNSVTNSYNSSAFGFLGIPLQDAYQCSTLQMDYIPADQNASLCYYPPYGYYEQSSRLLPSLKPQGRPIPLLPWNSSANSSSTTTSINSQTTDAVQIASRLASIPDQIAAHAAISEASSAFCMRVLHH